MTTTISPDDYCKNPQAYKNTPGLTDQTRQYWDNYCALKKDLEASDTIDSKSLREAAPEAFENLLLTLVSPEGLEMIAKIEGVKVSYRTVKYAVAKMLKSGLDEEVLKAAEAFIAKGGDEAIANAGGVIFGFGKDLAYIDIKVAEKAGYSAGEMAVSSIFKGLDVVVDLADWAMIILMLVAMILDAWDPCNLNTQLNNEQLQSFSNSFNTQFRTVLLVNLQSVQDSYGNTIFSALWPLEYYAEKSALIPFKNDYYNTIEQNLMYSYLNSLNFNSCGQPITRIKAGTGKLVNNNILTSMRSSSFSYLADNNTVVTNWLIKWWPLLLGSLISIIIIIYLIRKRK